MRSAVARIRVFKLSSMPPALRFEAKGRSFGGYQEENIRFTSYYGSTPDGAGWSNFYKAAYRFGVHSKFLGANLWQQTIGNYQATLWPCRTIKGYGPETEGGACIGGPLSQKDPVTKDAVRLQLLLCEKFGMDYIGELHLPANWAFMLHMDKVFGGKGTVDDNGPQKPWLAVSKSGECVTESLIKPYWNPFYPGVQDWTASVISEIANRYKDSPAFKGISIRLMAWCFSGWQTTPSNAEAPKNKFSASTMPTSAASLVSSWFMAELLTCVFVAARTCASTGIRLHGSRCRAPSSGRSGASSGRCRVGRTR